MPGYKYNGVAYTSWFKKWRIYKQYTWARMLSKSFFKWPVFIKKHWLLISEYVANGRILKLILIFVISSIKDNSHKTKVDAVCAHFCCRFYSFIWYIYLGLWIKKILSQTPKCGTIVAKLLKYFRSRQIDKYEKDDKEGGWNMQLLVSIQPPSY